MRIDLHTHSNRSDGTESPSELIRSAAAAGLDVVALTDHDTTDGWHDAHLAAAEAGVTFVPGVEISTRLRGVGVHVLAYYVDPANPLLSVELERIRADRRDRLQRIVASLKSAGVAIRMDDVLKHAESADSVGRPHVADALVAMGHVRNRTEAFATWLAEGRAGYVAKYAPETSRAVRMIHAAGGVAVLAHPWGRVSRRVLDRGQIAALVVHGLDGLEVDHADHDDEHRRGLRAVAEDLGLVVTGSSDYHGTGKIDHPLGLNTTAPAQWERLSSLAILDDDQRVQGA